VPASKEIYHENRGVITASMVRLLFALSSSAWANDKEGKITDLVKAASETVPGTVVEAELEKKHGKQYGKLRSSAPTEMSRKSISMQAPAP